MKTRRGSKQIVKARPVIGWLIVALIVGLELWTVCSWYGDHAGGNTGRTADAGTPALTAPSALW